MIYEIKVTATDEITMKELSENIAMALGMSAGILDIHYVKPVGAQ